jgi:transketolase
VPALHIAPAFSCVEIVDTIYFSLMRNSRLNNDDIFIMSKGHGCIIQYVILNHLGFISDLELSDYCSPRSSLGAHPDYGTPGIHASTGSLGHGLGIALGQAHAENLLGSDVRVFCLLSDGELQEGSTWEAFMMAANMKMKNLVAFIDLNDFGGLERMSIGHYAFYPVEEKLTSFGWETFVVDGHNTQEIIEAFKSRTAAKPTVIICKTIKGRGVSFMENVPIWHYRSPNADELKKALEELDSTK